jgi:hypothetical protein
LAANREQSGSPAMSEEPEVSDSHKASRQDVEQKASQEFFN